MKRINTVGTGVVQTVVIDASTSIVFLLATSSKETRASSKWNKIISKKKLTKNETNSLLRINQVKISLSRPSRDIRSVPPMERRQKETKGPLKEEEARRRLKEGESKRRAVEDW